MLGARAWTAVLLCSSLVQDAHRHNSQAATGKSHCPRAGMVMQHPAKAAMCEPGLAPQDEERIPRSGRCQANCPHGYGEVSS